MALLVLGILAMLATPAGASAQACPAAAGPPVEAGWRALRAGDAAAARDAFEAALRACPGDAGARVGLGYAALRQDRVGEARALFAGVAAERPQDVDALLGLGQAEARAGRFGAARAAYGRVLAIDAGNAEAERGLARVLAWEGRTDEAADAFRALAARDPADVDAWIGLSQALRWGGAEAEALAAARRAAALAPDRADVRTELADARLPFRPTARAAGTLEQDSDGMDVYTATVRGTVRVGPGTELRADVHLRRAHQEVRAPDDPDPLANGEEATTSGVTVTLGRRLSSGWRVSATAGAALPDAADASPIAVLGAAAGGRVARGATVVVAYLRSAWDYTVPTIRAEIVVDELSLTGGWRGGGWTVEGDAAASLARARASGEQNERLGGGLAAWRAIGGGVTLGAAARAFGFRRDLGDGYFDPGFFGLVEANARWARAFAGWEAALEVAPGVQTVEGEGATGALRGAASLARVVSPGRRVEIAAVGAQAGARRLSPETADGDDRYFALTLSGAWTF